MKKFDWNTIQEYAHYVGDSYTHIRQMIKKQDVDDIVDSFFKINKLLEESKKRYEKT